MRIVGIDLAARWSGAVILNAAGSVTNEFVGDFGPAEKPANLALHFRAAEQFANDIFNEIAIFHDLGGIPYLYYEDVVIILEDVSHFMADPKPAIRVQTIVAYEFIKRGIPVRLVMASQWQKHHGFKKIVGQTTKGWANVKATELGYNPAPRWGNNKSSVDLRDAFLLARYGFDTLL